MTPAERADLRAYLAAIKECVDNLPTRWMFWALLVPIYAILAILLWTALRA